ncbi:conserved hypothetical protein [Salmonella enterica subsp. enterica serovar Hadar str. RI_05P066]|nr:conserved hypothetical protein [Salmonella enterica subsp. enterica serovar Hadar str. RI_05P066]
MARLSLYAGGAVYPRWRGEHLIRLQLNGCATGLSPLARGTRTPCSSLLIRGRFIPAGAGNTRTGMPDDGSVAVYPRWRGEHSKSTQLNLNTFLAHKKPTNFS